MAGRIFIFGDTHGAMEIQRLGARAFPQGTQLDKDDYAIICGDFGLVWKNDSEDRYWLRWLDKKPFTTLFVDGNHENFDMLDAMESSPWHGGMVHRVNDSVLHLMRGHVFELSGRRFFAMGGATSVDKAWRTPHTSWWEQELPSLAERQFAEQTLHAHGWEVDYVLTHCAAANIQYRLDRTFANDSLTNFLFDVEQRLAYRHWFFGHYHLDKRVGDGQTCLYDNIYEIVLGASAEQDRIELVRGEL